MKYPFEKISWRKRSKKIASNIPKGSAVIDLGGGDEHLFHFLKEPIAYYPIDSFKRTERTIVADFNAGEYPEIFTHHFGSGVYIVAAGIIEYISDAPIFLNRIKQYGDKLVISYLQRVGNAGMERKQTMSLDSFSELLGSTGWKISKEMRLSDHHKIFYCETI